MNIWTFSLRFQACMKKYKPPPMPPKISHQYLTKNSLMAITNSVGAGRSAPKEREHLLEGRDHEDHDHRHHDERHHDAPRSGTSGPT